MSYWQAIERISSSPTPNTPEQTRSLINTERCIAVDFASSPRFLLAAFCFFLWIVPACSSVHPNDHRIAETAVSEAPSTSVIAPTRNNSDLARALDQILAGPDYATARWGVAIVSLRDGKLLYGRNEDMAFTPASNMKIFTTAVALDLLGPDYRWRTSVYADNEPDGTGSINGDLVLYGRGAPDLLSQNQKENPNSLEELALTLVKRGVKRVTGNVIGDESYFRGEAVGDGWQQNDLQWYFGAEASALTINGNSADINIVPARKLSESPTVTVNDSVADYIHVINNTATVEHGKRFRIGVYRGLSDNNVIVWGEVPIGVTGYGVNLSVHQPSLWSARLFMRILREHGITIDGTATYRDWRTPENWRFTPKDKHELTYVLSSSLGEIARLTNKHSINLYAELILRTLGRERVAMLGANDESQIERGDEVAGTEIIRLWLERRGLKTDRLALHDGSGLSRLDLVTPRTAATLLSAISVTGAGNAFKESLPVAGVDGTLMGRLPQLAGQVAAKTGALTYDNSLSGYLTSGDGEVIAFSIMCNDYLKKAGAISLIDRLVTTISTISKSSRVLVPPPKSRKT